MQKFQTGTSIWCVTWGGTPTARGKRAKVLESLKEQDSVTQAAATLEAASEFASRAKASRARLIRKVYEADRLVCPKCRSNNCGPMRVIALIDDPAVVRRILEHLGRWAPEPAERGPPGEAPDWPRNAARTTRAAPDSRSFDAIGIASDRAQAQDALDVVPGSAESAEQHSHRPDARNRRD